MKVEYVVLQYCPDVLSSFGRSVAVVYRRIEAVPPDGLHLILLKDWNRYVAEQDVPYLKAVFDDIPTTDDLDSRYALEQLQELSASSLRAERQGTCEESGISDILNSAECH